VTASELDSLRGDARQIWMDAAERRGALERIAAALTESGAGLDAAVRRVDDAVVIGLEALGYPRGRVRGVVIDDAGRLGPTGRKTVDCTLVIYGDRLRQILGDERGPDAVFKTWVHESIHARQPYAPGHHREYGQFPGYEEGLAEGLAGLIVREKAGMVPPGQSYRWYVAAYRGAATVFRIDVVALWGRLWERPLGEARAAFVDAVDLLRQQGGAAALTPPQRVNLQVMGDRVFSSARTNDPPNERAIMDLWRVVRR
jgi:hypothetical protein